MISEGWSGGSLRDFVFYNGSFLPVRPGKEYQCWRDDNHAAISINNIMSLSPPKDWLAHSRNSELLCGYIFAFIKLNQSVAVEWGWPQRDFMRLLAWDSSRGEWILAGIMCSCCNITKSCTYLRSDKTHRAAGVPALVVSVRAWQLRSASHDDINAEKSRALLEMPSPSICTVLCVVIYLRWTRNHSVKGLQKVREMNEKSRLGWYSCDQWENRTCSNHPDTCLTLTLMSNLCSGCPYDAQVREVRDDSLVLLWAAPLYEGRGPVIGYLVEISEGEQSDCWMAVNEEPVCDTHYKVGQALKKAPVQNHK